MKMSMGVIYVGKKSTLLWELRRDIYADHKIDNDQEDFERRVAK